MIKLAVCLACGCLGYAAEIKVGIIGLDTSHSPAFTRILNDPRFCFNDYRVLFAKTQ